MKKGGWRDPWPGPGLASQPLPIAAPGFSAQAGAPRAKSESQGGGARTCSVHSLSPGAALHATGLEALAAYKGGAALLLAPPLCHPDALDMIGRVNWAPPTDLGPLLHSHLPVLVHMPRGRCPCGAQGSQFLSHTLTSAGMSHSLLYPTGRFLLFSHVPPLLRSLPCIPEEAYSNSP